MRSTLALSRVARSPRRFSPHIRKMLARRLAGPLAAAVVVAGATVTGVLGGSTAGAVAASAAGATAASDAAVASAAGQAAGSAAGAVASEPFQAGQPGLLEAPLPAVVATAQVERAARTGSLLGLPRAARRSATRVVDRFGGGTYDEVAEYDAGGRLISSQRFATDGRLLAAVRFGWRADGGPVLAGVAGARVRAERLVATLGLETVGAPRVVAAPSNAGWTVAWGRMVGGVPVPGDGLRVQLWPDGSVHGLAHSERALAQRPAVLLEVARARSIVGARLDAWFHGQARRDVMLSGLALAWVPPNDTFAPAGPDAPGAVLRLAWVARVTTSGALTDSLRALEVYVDAGDGSMLGGDILQ